MRCPICGEPGTFLSSIAGAGKNQHRCSQRVLDKIDEDRGDDFDARRFGRSYTDRLRDGMAMIRLAGDGETRRAQEDAA